MMLEAWLYENPLFGCRENVGKNKKNENFNFFFGGVVVGW